MRIKDLLTNQRTDDTVHIQNHAVPLKIPPEDSAKGSIDGCRSRTAGHRFPLARVDGASGMITLTEIRYNATFGVI